MKRRSPFAGGWPRGRILKTVASVCLALLASATSFARSQDPQTSPSKSAPTQRAPSNPASVVLDDRTIFEVRWGYKTFTPARRAAHISEELKRLSNEPAAPRLTVQPEDATVDVMAGDSLVASVFDGDAKAAGVDKEQLAQQWASATQSALDGYRVRHSLRLRIIRVLLGLLTIVVCVVLVALVRVIMRWLAARTEARLEEHTRRGDRRVTVFLGHPRTRDYVARAFTVGSLILSLAILWFGLRLLFYVFPATRWLSELMHQSVFGPIHSFESSFLESLPSLIFVLLVMVVTWYVIRLVHFFFGRIHDREITIEGFRPIWAPTTDRLFTFALIILAALIAYPYIPGSGSPAFKGISLFLGVLVSLGSTGIVANLVTGIALTYVDAFEIGDLVKIGDVIGYITKMGILTTRVHTRKNEIITLPNSLVAGKETVNYSKMSQTGLIIAAKVGIGYDAPWRQVEGMLKLAASRTHGVKSIPEPFVLELSLNTFDVTYELNTYIEEGELPHIVLAALNRNVLDAFNEFGVQIMTPAYVADPRDTKVVPRDQWHMAPSDRIAGTSGPEPESGGSKAAD